MMKQDSSSGRRWYRLYGPGVNAAGDVGDMREPWLCRNCATCMLRATVVAQA